MLQDAARGALAIIRQSGMHTSRRFWALWIAAPLALFVGCGGEELGPQRIDGLQLSVDDKAVALAAPAAGGAYELTIDSGAAVEVITGEAMDVDIDAGESTALVEADEAQRYRVRLRAPGGADVVITITAEAAPDSPVRLRLRVAPQRFDNRFRRAGQVLTYRKLIRDLEGSLLAEGIDIERTGDVSPTGDYTVVLADHNTPEHGELNYRFYDADGHDLGFSYFVWSTIDGERYDDGDGCEQRWTGVAQGFPLYVGKRWSVVNDGGCNSNDTIEHEVLRYALVKTPAGVFPSLLRRRTLAGHPESPQECWWAVDLGLNVSCTSKRFVPGFPVGPPREVGTETRELVSIAG